MDPLTKLTAAAACVAQIMGTAPVMPDAYADKPAPFCPSYAPNCTAVTYQPRGSAYIVIIAPADDFALLAHEACHALQFAQGWSLDEPTCHAIERRARAGECNDYIPPAP